MLKRKKFVSVVLTLVVSVVSSLVVADPGNGKGHGNNKGNAHGDQGPDKVNGKGGAARGGPSVDRGAVLGVLGGYRTYWNPGPALPPGIQKKLARGKPLPPGIAKKLDRRLLGHLPRYDGYEWQQAGTDLILVTIATGIIYEVLNGVFD
ncbi:anti-virulence regulator CigR family protein [Pseudomonas palleroniana]|uniref:anti-virulence regulator CigR family protein n=1 Tax=Pseudomonas palleroniana TaxID=191390 RepID=UPI0018E673A8|nr:anti-virulence regulator CigR family protein [Pseudomonas palleroniana]MBI6909649.1 RcnB family protein [Pseudomonas palleroniana]